MTDLINLTGRQSGHLIARQRLPNANPKNRNSLWLCDCHCRQPDCKKQVVVFSAHFRSGHTKSCGSLRRTQKNNLKHGHAINPSPIYRAWINMKNRCNNPRCHEYHRYGGRGITYCERWEEFENFLADMGPTWFEGAEFDRIDPINDNYCKERCRWIPEGTGLRSTTIQVQWRGEIMPLGTAAKKAKVNPASAHYIMRYRQCSFEEAAASLERNKDGDGLKSNCVRVTLNGKIMPLSRAAKEVGINYFNLYRLIHRRGFSFDQAVKHIRDNKLAT